MSVAFTLGTLIGIFLGKLLETGIGLILGIGLGTGLGIILGIGQFRPEECKFNTVKSFILSYVFGNKCCMQKLADDTTKGSWDNNTTDMISNSGNWSVINKSTFKFPQKITSDSSMVSFREMKDS